MLYVFLVNTGDMIALDMNIALESVTRLKEKIHEKTNVVPEKQVLLISGGECLNPSARVCSYSAAGTDTNPIFLFDKFLIECEVPPIKNEKDGENKENKGNRENRKETKESKESKEKEKENNDCNIEAILNMPATYMTIVSRSQLAQQFYDLAKEEARACELNVHHQHLQQQGWAAVVANLDDVVSAFKKRAELIELSFQSYMEKRTKQADLLETFDKDLEILKKIPVLKSLLQKCNEGASGNVISLHDWINFNSSQDGLESMIEQYSKGLEHFDQKFHNTIMMEAALALNMEKHSDMKEVRGIEERLYGLDYLMSDVKKVVQEQADLAQAFLQNQTRASNLRDPSILPDLCANQRNPLKIMVKNHKHLKDVHRRCIMAKDELIINLHMRLRWVVHVERVLMDVDNKLVLYHENLKRLKKHLDAVQQIHLAPSIYFLSVAEVSRRKSFSKDYLKWSRELSQQASIAYETEVTARDVYMRKVGNHFLQSLFPGLESIPGEFALQPPDEFDTDLPDISSSDVQYLRNALPEVASILDDGGVHKIAPLTITNELPNTRDVFVSAMENAHSVSITMCNVQETLPGESPTDDKDPESEPDTEEFEKVDQCTGLADVVLTAETNKEDENRVKEKVLHLQSVISNIKSQHKILVEDVRLSLKDTRTYVANCQKDVTELSNALASQFSCAEKKVIEEYQSDLSQAKRNVLDAVQERVTQQVEESFASGFNLISQRCDQTIANLETKIQNCSIHVSQLGKRLADRATALRRLTLEHELELVNLREEHKLDCAAFDKRINELVMELNDRNNELDKIREDAMIETEARLEQERQRILESLKEEFILREQNILKQQLEELELRHENELQRVLSESELQRKNEKAFLQNKFSEEYALLRNELIQDKQTAIDMLKESMTTSHQMEMETLKVKALSMDRSPSDGSLEKIERPESTDPSYLEQQVIQLRTELQEKDMAMEKLRALYEQQLLALQQQSEQSQDVIRKTLVSTTAEKQVIFNEAVTRLTAEKDKLIKELQARIKHMQEEIDRVNGKMKTLTLTTAFDIQPSSPSEALGNLSESLMAASAIEQSTFVEDRMSKSVPTQMEASTSNVSGIPHIMEKISFLTCSVGDLVLLTYDHRHENYIAFTISSTLYFLNSDCYDELGLIKDPGETKKNWVLGYVTEKEYCQAKKEQNRFRVPKGTRFYRIRVKQWTLDSSSKRVGAMCSSTSSVASPKK